VKSLKNGDVFYRYASSLPTKPRDRYVPPEYEKMRDEKKIERYVITNAGTAARKKRKFEKDVRVVPKSFDLFEYNITALIYANKVAFVDYNTETAVVIENPVLAEFQKKLFKLLFSKL
jgi:hypothetical protein